MAFAFCEANADTFNFLFILFSVFAFETGRWLIGLFLFLCIKLTH